MFEIHGQEKDIEVLENGTKNFDNLHGIPAYIFGNRYANTGSAHLAGYYGDGVALPFASVREKAGTKHFKMPNMYRDRGGAVHSIVRHTGAPHTMVESFIDDWIAANREVQRILGEEIFLKPFRNYFA